MAKFLISKKEAEELVSGLRDDLLSAGRRIVKIIEARAWEPIGYASFTELWHERLDGVPLSGAIKAHVVYALLDTSTPEEIGSTVTGVSTKAARKLKEQKDLGKPADLASVRVNTYVRRPPSVPQMIHVEVSPLEYAAWTGIASLEKNNIGEYAANVLREHFSAKLHVVAA